MDPFQTFSWCLSIMRFSAELIQPNIFQDNKRTPNRKLYRLNVIVLGFAIAGAFYTVKFHNKSRAFTATLVIFGLGQVNFARKT